MTFLSLVALQLGKPAPPPLATLMLSNLSQDIIDALTKILENRKYGKRLVA